ncbi:MAG: circadian clock KaiB family protein [Ignavibacteriales bacterium]
MITLELFIAGGAANSARALRNLKAALAAIEATVDLLVVDVLDEPERAWADGIFVTPLLIRRGPPPVQMLLGSMDDAAGIAAFIGATT